MLFIWKETKKERKEMQDLIPGFNQLNGFGERERAFDTFMRYKKTLDITAQRALRRKYENERSNLKAGVMGYMRVTGDLNPR